MRWAIGCVGSVHAVYASSTILTEHVNLFMEIRMQVTRLSPEIVYHAVLE